MGDGGAAPAHTGGSTHGSADDLDLAGIEGITVLGVLGQGTNGSVYRVRHASGEYALKVLTATSGDGLTAFRREAALLAGVLHPGLLRIHEVGLTGGRPYLVMDLAQGRLLAEELAAGPLPEARVLRVAADLAAALGAVHRAGLVHREVNPRNVMTGADGAARLIDVGLAARGGGTAGTLAYAAPEQAGTLNRPVDGRADLYALGVLLYECVTGRLPYESADLRALLRMHATAPVPDPRQAVPGLSAGLVAVLNTLLAKDPDDRYASAAALLADLAALDRQPGAAFTPTPRPALAAAATPAPLIGREAELRRLTAAWDRAAGGLGGIALLRGAAGSGTSRLAAELAAAVPGGWVLRGTCAPDDPVPLAPLRAAVSGWLGTLAAGPAADRDRAYGLLRQAAAPAAAALTGWCPALDAVLATAPAGDGFADPGQFSIVVAAFLADLARAAGGLLLAFDDVQWLDPGTARVLSELAAQHLADLPLLVLLTARDGEDSADRVEALLDGLRPAVPTDIVLPPLGERDIAGLIADHLPGARTGAELAHQVAVRSGGNPFLALETLRAIVDAGLLRPYWGQWLLDEPGLAALDLPRHPLGLVLARVAELGTTTRKLLTVAAVAGGRFRPEVVAAAARTDLDTLRGALAEAAGRHLVQAHTDGSYSFPHGSIREALVSGAREARLHQRLAEVLDAGAGGPDQEYARAGHHLRGVRDATPVAAFTACVAAARLALAAHSPVEAVAFLDHAAGLGLDLGVEVHHLYGTALQRAGQPTRALGQLRAALAGTATPTDRAAILLRIAETHRAMWDSDQAIRAVREGLAELDLPLPAGAPRLLLSSVRLLLLGLLVGATRIGFGRVSGTRRERYRLAVLLHRTAAEAAGPRRDRRSICYRLRTLFWANRLGPSVEYTLGLSALGYADLLLGRNRAAGRAFRRAAAVATDLPDPGAAAAVAHTRAAGMFHAGHDHGAGLRRVVLEQRRWLGAGPYSDAVAAVVWLALTEGRTGEAVEWAERGWQRLALAGDPELTALIAARACVLAATGRPADAAAEIGRVADLVRPGSTSALRPAVAGAELYTLVEQGELGPPLDHAIERLALSRPRRASRTGQQSYVHVALARLAQCRAAGDADAGRAGRLAQARTEVRRARAAARKGPAMRAYGDVLRADLLVLQGKPERALRALRDLRPPRPDAPLVAYEAGRVRARAYAALGAAEEAHRQARAAAVLAADQRWPHRARWIAAEFGVGA